MALKIRLKRMGAIRRPYYRIVVMEALSSRDGKAIDEVGLYHPVEAPEAQVRLDEEKIAAWLEKGAKPTNTVKKLLNAHGIYMPGAAPKGE